MKIQNTNVLHMCASMRSHSGRPAWACYQWQQATAAHASQTRYIGKINKRNWISVSLNVCQLLPVHQSSSSSSSSSSLLFCKYWSTYQHIYTNRRPLYACTLHRWATTSWWAREHNTKHRCRDWHFCCRFRELRDVHSNIPFKSRPINRS